MTSDRLVIAIDGPSGSGKSSTAREVARRLGLEYLDTGAMYRAVTWAFLEEGIDPADAKGVIEATRKASLEISTDPRRPRVRVNGHDVTAAIREPRISATVSTVATLPACRADLVARQRAIIDAAPRGIVAEGRDVTTVIAPDADVRVLITAAPDARLSRRDDDLRGTLSAEQLHDQVIRRDRDDSALVEFERPADGVLLLDNTHLTLDEAVDRVINLAEEARR